VLAIGLALALVCVAVRPVAAESALWTLVASPLAVTTGSTTTFALTATNEDPLSALLSSAEIGCVVVDVPTNFTVVSAAVTGSTAGPSWAASRSANQVRVQAGSGGDRLAYLQSVSFTIRATALSSGSLIWSSRAYRQEDCSGTGALPAVPPIVLVSDTAATPTPAPTATPTPAPTQTASPTPTPLLPLPSLPLPSLPVLTPPPASLPGSATPAPTATPRATPEPGSSAEPSRTPTDGVPSAPPSSADPGGGVPGTPGGSSVGEPGGEGEAGAPGEEPVSAPAAGVIPVDDGTLELDLGRLGLIGGVDTWIVPSATLGVSGLLILIWIGLQGLGAFAWIPAVRRLRGDEETS
jgi:hypothetical protein